MKHGGERQDEGGRQHLPVPPDAPHDADRVAQAAQRAARQARTGRDDPEPSLGRRLGQIGILGWSVVVPTLLGLVLGRWLDHRFATGVFFSAPMLMLGAGFGLWSAWKWMHRQGAKP